MFLLGSPIGIMVFIATGYLIIYNQACKLAPQMPEIGGLGAFKWLIDTNLNCMVTSISVQWPTAMGELEDFLLLTRVSHDDLKLTREHYSPFVESEGDTEVKKALEKGLGEMVGEFTTFQTCTMMRDGRSQIRMLEVKDWVKHISPGCLFIISLELKY